MRSTYSFPHPTDQSNALKCKTLAESDFKILVGYKLAKHYSTNKSGSDMFESGMEIKIQIEIAIFDNIYFAYEGWFQNQNLNRCIQLLSTEK